MGMAVDPLPLADGFPVLAAEPPRTSKMEKERYTQMMFEELHASSVALVSQAQLTLTTFAESTAVVIDLGHETIGAPAAASSQQRSSSRPRALPRIPSSALRPPPR